MPIPPIKSPHGKAWPHPARGAQGPVEAAPDGDPAPWVLPRKKVTIVIRLLVNRSGGAIPMGHPIGMSGARITLHAALELSRRGGGYAVAALCGAGGQGDALILRAG